MAATYPPIPDPIADTNSIRDTAAALKEGVEILTGQRGIRANAAVTWQDLLDLGLISANQMPVQPTSGR